ncbi:MAG: TetR/AcrR family transcriptional regulator [Bradyrhizobium sp.]|uniref:TetR/AcrR family transcriptional regulator n=1 Tax=Bradyrhizobium sp. TaxID=376 RepID=UPI0025BB7646|nr:TetR/AcrR family transcriptional regulator [Bradyrhizobium sp.]MBI5265154.1 TetR/AcrR family transcriptional regulator [Bradyrhizobium sp.]
MPVKNSKSPRPARAAHGQRRHDLMKAGRACFAESGVEGTTVEDLLSRSGASIGSLYQHFKGKDGLAAALYLEGMEMFFAKARARLRGAETTADGAKALVRAYFDCAEEDPGATSFLIKAREYLDKTRYAAEIERKNAEFMPEVGAWFRQKIKARELREIAPDYIMAIIEGPARQYVKRWLAAPGAPLKEAREVLAQAAWDALRRSGKE